MKADQLRVQHVALLYPSFHLCNYYQLTNLNIPWYTNNRQYNSHVSFDNDLTHSVIP